MASSSSGLTSFPLLLSSNRLDPSFLGVGSVVGNSVTSFSSLVPRSSRRDAASTASVGTSREEENDPGGKNDPYGGSEGGRGTVKGVDSSSSEEEEDDIEDESDQS